MFLLLCTAFLLLSQASAAGDAESKKKCFSNSITNVATRAFETCAAYADLKTIQSELKDCKDTLRCHQANMAWQMTEVSVFVRLQNQPKGVLVLVDLLQDADLLTTLKADISEAMHPLHITHTTDYVLTSTFEDATIEVRTDKVLRAVLQTAMQNEEMAKLKLVGSHEETAMPTPDPTQTPTDPPTQPFFSDSKILTTEDKEWLMTALPDRWGADMGMCYRGSDDGWRASDYHSECDADLRKFPQLNIVETTDGVVMGFYQSFPVTKHGGWTNDDGNKKNFLFYIRGISGYGEPEKIKQKSSGSAYYYQNGYGPTTGGNHDFVIHDNCNANTSSYANPGSTYEEASYGTYLSSKSKAAFTCKEWEVWHPGH